MTAPACPHLPGAPDPDLPRTPLSGAAYHRDPYPLLRALTAAGQAHPVRFPAVHAWLITGYAAARAALTDPRLGKDHARANPHFLAHASVMPQPQRSRLQVHLLHVDGERHRRMRALVARGLSAPAAESARPSIRAFVDDLIDDFPEPGSGTAEVDLAAALGRPLALTALAEAIGLPDDLRDAFDPDWGAVVAPVGPEHPERPTYERRLRELEDYIAAVVVDAARPQRRAGILGEVVAAAAAGVITAAERDSIIFQLLVAGQDPVSAQLGLCVLGLLEHPGLVDRLRAEPSAAPAIVEELLRHDAAFSLTTWRFLDRGDRLGGVDIPAGDSVIVSLGAANRDPDAFADPDAIDPDRYAVDGPRRHDVDGPRRPHLAFGHGAHRCPGAALARVQLAEALIALTSRLEGLRLACPRDALEWSTAPLTRAVRRLPVTYRGKGPRR
ncbi:hypothetical protein GGQ54_000196 [Naumannella cuiyingiana]|uniref:Cytochrome P450 n=1 Tax=Naumannella cuiyingiana TaxID=1347891 RepID=A0A7Z0IJN6_9ACTN|nr:cytochrome P450 [Naumannella cuiyingiana]NYI69636.1 hypothetical protein [Naumannella cuiyingiana]